MSKTIAVIGAGYVGLTTAVLLAESDYLVYLVDINQNRLQSIKEGRSFFYEEGLDPLIAHSVSSGSLKPTDSYQESIPDCDFIFSCVGTPDNPDGSSNLEYVYSSATQASKFAKNGAIFIQKSTVPVGTGENIESSFAGTKKQIPYVSNPEFLREGTAIADTLWFDRIVVGSSNRAAAKKVLELYKTIEKKRATIAKRAGIKKTQSNNGQYIQTNRDSAELIKVTANAFLALKISFANSIAKLADHTGADIQEVMDAVGADRRIGRAFLNAGRGYGGGCFPKDVSGLISSANDHGIDLPIMVAAADVNDTMPGYIAHRAQEVLGGLSKKKVAVLGLAFKAGTSDARRSPGVKLANSLARSGAKVSAYDPKANGEAREDLRRDVMICDNVAAATQKADAIFITTDWAEFKVLNLKELRSNMRDKVFVDGMNMFEPSDIKKAGFTYVGIGRS